MPPTTTPNQQMLTQHSVDSSHTFRAQLDLRKKFKLEKISKREKLHEVEGQNN